MPPSEWAAPEEIIATPISATMEELGAVQFDESGLAPAIIQEAETGVVLMLGWMNAGSLQRTLETGRTWFWSRSRQELWCKGETSGDRQWVREAFYDCDNDTLLFLVEQEGRGACHTGERTCFFRAFGGAATPGPV
ncbi:MAG TPA: phosphoribosyl-AMP cyclohydrolase [Acidimicrobiia bacterium]